MKLGLLFGAADPEAMKAHGEALRDAAEIHSVRMGVASQHFTDSCLYVETPNPNSEQSHSTAGYYGPPRA